jgi:hypothetical protein
LTSSTIISNAIAFRTLATVTSWLVNTNTYAEIAVFELFTLINVLACSKINPSAYTVLAGPKTQVITHASSEGGAFTRYKNKIQSVIPQRVVYYC